MEYTKNDKLDFMIALALSQHEDPELAMYKAMDTSDVVLDKNFYKKRDKIIRKYKYKPIARQIKAFASKAAVFVVAIIFASTLAVAAIPPLRNAIIDAIVEWHENYLTIQFDGAQITEGTKINSETEETTETETEAPTESEPAQTQTPAVSVTTKIPPTTIEEVRKPTYVPEGVVEDMVQNKVQVFVDYYSGDELLYSFEQMLFKEKTLYVDSENTDVNNLTINGYSAQAVKNISDEVVFIVWNDGEYIYQISSYSCDLNYLKVIAESVPIFG